MLCMSVIRVMLGYQLGFVRVYFGFYWGRIRVYYVGGVGVLSGLCFWYY